VVQVEARRDHVDAGVMYAQRGHGALVFIFDLHFRRRLGDGALVPVGTDYPVFTDAELTQLERGYATKTRWWRVLRPRCARCVSPAGAGGRLRQRHVRPRHKYGIASASRVSTTSVWDKPAAKRDAVEGRWRSWLRRVGKFSGVGVQASVFSVSFRFSFQLERTVHKNSSTSPSSPFQRADTASGPWRMCISWMRALVCEGR